MQRRFFNANDAFEFYFDKIKKCGELRDNTFTLFNESFVLLYPMQNSIETSWRKWKESYAELEYQWYMTGDRNPSMVEKYAKLWTEIKDERGYVNSNYGAWWKRNDQLNKVIKLLIDQPTTRRAIIVHYSPDELDEYVKDTPCNVVLNFYIRLNELHLTVFARSIDLVYGFCNDQYCFSRLMEDVANELRLSVGTLTYHITNFHVYSKHWNMNEKP